MSYSNYTETLSMNIPSEYSEVAAKIARALDPDVGGADSFQKRIEGYEESLSENLSESNMLPIYSNNLYCSVLCTPEFKEQVLAIFSDTSAETLFAVVQADYERRWIDLPVPSLDECKVFLQNLKIEN